MCSLKKAPLGMKTKLDGMVNSANFIFRPKYHTKFALGFILCHYFNAGYAYFGQGFVLFILLHCILLSLEMEFGNNVFS